MKPRSLLRIPSWVTTYRLSDGSEHRFVSTGADLGAHQALFHRQVVEQLPSSVRVLPTMEHALEWDTPHTGATS